VCVSRVLSHGEMSTSTDLNLFNSRSLEPQVKTIVAQTANLGMTLLIADADDWNLRSLDQLYQLLNTTASFNTQHLVPSADIHPAGKVR